MTPSFSRGSKGKHYRYYVSASLQQGGKSAPDLVQRVPAPEIEGLVSDFAKRMLSKHAQPLNEVTAVHLQTDQIQIDLPVPGLRGKRPQLEAGETTLFENKQTIRFAIAIRLPKRGGQCTITPSVGRKPKIDKTLIASLRANILYARACPAI